MKTNLYCNVLSDHMSRTLGLQHVHHLPWDQGAWFVFNEPTESGFWMKNTGIPLELLFLDNQYRIISIHHMKPHDKTIVKCDVPYKYALEVNPGWCDAYKLKSGDNLQDHVDLIFVTNNL